MSDWQKDLAEIWEAILTGVEELNNEVQEASAEFVDLIVGVAEQITSDLEAIAHDFKELNDEIWQDIDWSGSFDFTVDSEEDPADWAFHYEPRREATAEHQPACVGCRNYNGSMFGGNLLVCGFHPYGWPEGQCPDWEGDEQDRLGK
jgi:hypothetical protein